MSLPVEFGPPFVDRIQAAVERHEHPIIVGIDPHLALLPEEFSVARDPHAARSERADALAKFGCQLIDVLADRIGVVKPQSAFFEVLGADGIAAWETVIQHARSSGLLVLGDVKRGDIASTAAAYAEAHLAESPGRCDAVTLSPYLGDDSIEPFLPWVERGAGIFILVRTSNPGSAALQTRGTPTVAEIVAERVAAWGEPFQSESGWSSVGAVVGATHRTELAKFRAALPHTLLLLPGIGAQGAGPADVVDAFSDAAHPLRGALINSSRGISFAYRKRATQDWKAAASDALDELIRDVQAVLLAPRS